MRRLNIRQLEAFRAVMLSGTTTAAATALSVSQPSVSRLIGELEGQLGTELFVRGPGSLTPTREAEWLFREANDCLSRFDRLEMIARDIRHLSVGELRIVATPPLAFGLAPESVKRMRRDYPDLRVSLQLAFRREVRALTDAQNFDVALSTLPIDYPKAHSEYLARVHGVCILPTGHPLTRKNVVHAADLADEPFISPLPETMTRFRLDQFFDRLGIIRNQRTVESHTALTICQMVAAGLGVGIVDPFTAQNCLPLGIAIRPFAPAFDYEYGVLFPIRAPRSRLAETFTETVQQLVSEYPSYAAELETEQ